MTPGSVYVHTWWRVRSKPLAGVVLPGLTGYEIVAGIEASYGLSLSGGCLGWTAILWLRGLSQITRNPWKNFLVESVPCYM